MKAARVIFIQMISGEMHFEFSNRVPTPAHIAKRLGSDYIKSPPDTYPNPSKTRSHSGGARWDEVCKFLGILGDSGEALPTRNMYIYHNDKGWGNPGAPPSKNLIASTLVFGSWGSGIRGSTIIVATE